MLVAHQIHQLLELWFKSKYVYRLFYQVPALYFDKT